MARITMLTGENMALTAAVSVLAAFQTAAAAAAAANIKVKRLEVSQSGSTTLAEIRGQIATRNSSGTLTTTSQAPRNIRPVGGPASGLAGSTNVLGTAGTSGINASVDSGGTYTEIWAGAFPNTAGGLEKPDPFEELWIPASTIVVVRFKADPATLTGWNIVLVLDED